MNTKKLIYRYPWLLILVAFIVASVVVSCGDNPEVDSRLTEAERLLEQRPDSAFALLESLEPDLNGNNAETVQFGLLYAHARLRLGKTIAFDNNLERCIAYYLSKNDSLRLMDVYRLASIRAGHRLNQDSSVYYLQKAVSYTPSDHADTKSLLLTDLSYLLSKPSAEKDYRSALDFSKQAYGYATSAGEKARALHDIGVLYSFIGDNDSCLTYIERALGLIDLNNPAYTGFALNYANTPGSDPTKGEKYLALINDESLGKHITAGFLFLNNGATNLAARELNFADSIYLRQPEKYSINTFNNLRLLKGCIDFVNDHSIDVSYGVTVNDSISEMMNLDKQLSRERQEINQKLEKELLEQRLKRKNTLMWLFAIGFIATLVVLAIYYYWHRRYKRLQREIEKERVSQIILEASDSPIDEEAFRAIIAKRLQLCVARFRASGYYTKLQKIEADNNPETFLPLKQRGDIQEKLLQCFSDFIIDLKNESTKLNLEDILYCLLSLLNFNGKTISRCMGASEGALRTRKSRLKTKLSPFMLRLIFHDTDD